MILNSRTLSQTHFICIKFRMGTESRKASYLNHDALKFPGVGDYNISPGAFRSNGKTMGLKTNSSPNKNPGPLDYTPDYASI